MSWNASVDLFGRKYASNANLAPYVAAAFVTSFSLKHFAPQPWRHIPGPVVWLSFAVLALTVSFQRQDVPNVPMNKKE